MSRFLILILAFGIAAPASAHGTASRIHHHERSINDSYSPFSNYSCVFGTGYGRMCHRNDTVRPRRIRVSSNFVYGADFDAPMPVKWKPRQHLQSPAVLAKRPVKRAQHNIVPRPVEPLAGADSLTLRQCWDTVEMFYRWREKGGK